MFLSESRNLLRMDSYRRFDLRLDKRFSFDKGTVTLYTEVINMLNRRNPAAYPFNQFNPSTGAVRLSFYHLFPILPSIGLKAEF